MSSIIFLISTHHNAILPLQKIPDGPEMEEYKEMRKVFDRDFPNVLATISGGSNIDPLQLEIESTTIEELMDTATSTIERRFHFLNSV